MALKFENLAIWQPECILTHEFSKILLCNRAIPVHEVKPIMTMMSHILLTKMAEIVIMSIKRGIELRISIPLDTNESTGTLISLASHPKVNKRDNNLNTTIIAIKNNKLIASSATPLPDEKALESVYFLTPKA